MTTVLSRINQFEQCVLNISLIDICNQKSYIGQEMRRKYNRWKGKNDETFDDIWLDIHQFTIYLPHRDRQYPGMTLGYNVEVKPVNSLNQLPHRLPRGAHFVVVMRQKGFNSNFKIAGTGIFVRPLGILSLDLIVDADLGEHQSIIVKHPSIQNYPSDWSEKLNLFLKGKIDSEELPQLVKSVDQTCNPNYRQPSWQDIYLTAK